MAVVLAAVLAGLTIGLMAGLETDLFHQSISTARSVDSACVKSSAMGGEVGRCPRTSAEKRSEDTKGIASGPRNVKNPDVSTAEILRLQPTFISRADALNRLADPTSLVVVGTTLAGLGLVLRRLQRRRATMGSHQPEQSHASQFARAPGSPPSKGPR